MSDAQELLAINEEFLKRIEQEIKNDDWNDRFIEKLKQVRRNLWNNKELLE